MAFTFKLYFQALEFMLGSTLRTMSLLSLGPNWHSYLRQENDERLQAGMKVCLLQLVLA